MPKKELIEIANNADMIVNGYAFTKKEERFLFSPFQLLTPVRFNLIITNGQTDIKPTCPSFELFS